MFYILHKSSYWYQNKCLLETKNLFKKNNFFNHFIYTFKIKNSIINYVESN